MDLALNTLRSLLLPLSALIAVASSPAEIRDTLMDLRGEGIQWELPDGSQVPRTSSNWELGLPITEFIVVVLIGVALVAVGFFVASYVRDRRQVQVEDPQDISAPEVRLSPRPLESARAAALRGDFREAIHLLLLGTFQEIRASLGYQDHPSWTSREIQGRAPLPAGAKIPLGNLVDLVERSHFGAREIGEAEYQRAVEWHGELRRECERKRR